jgi:hypothetical protein
VGVSGLKGNIERRLEALEGEAKPRVISTLTDFTKHVYENSDEDVELSPELAAALEDFSKHCKEKNNESKSR